MSSLRLFLEPEWVLLAGRVELEGPLASPWHQWPLRTGQHGHDHTVMPGVVTSPNLELHATPGWPGSGASNGESARVVGVSRRSCARNRILDRSCGSATELLSAWARRVTAMRGNRHWQIGRRWRLFPKYAMLIITVVGGVLIASGAIGVYSRGARSRRTCGAADREGAGRGDAHRAVHPRHRAPARLDGVSARRQRGDALEERRIEYLKLLRQVPAITELVWIGAEGREQLRVSRLAMDAVGAGTDLSKEPAFRGGARRHDLFGPVYVPQGHRAVHGDRAAGRRRRRRDGGRGEPEVRLGRGVAHQDRRRPGWPTWSMPPAR